MSNHVQMLKVPYGKDSFPIFRVIKMNLCEAGSDANPARLAFVSIFIRHPEN